ncbi:DUF1476 domain-containing protein [Microvirga sp. 17 mud 1-3]|uniref:DUF1476 domain-containing protein n=1 Tax=Microvirga sp. 17 mud 1-3 TaxID=2082949 RepID=UPI000D6D7744|nr:DUF1476 domain-containing protein [Microvirga sp. 17 mud 1-3]AWM87094.1 DUF1476 domain-containing protein [Microvirga sp. 17 mud 1-3]
MTILNQRRDAFEGKFAHDEEMLFKAIARRNKLLGLWAARRLGKAGAEADAYADTVVFADLEEAGDGDVLRKIAGDFNAAGIPVDDAQIRRQLEELMPRAINEIKTGG